MKIPKLSIEEFFTLPEDEQVYFMEVCRHGAFSISVSDYLFGHVKELQLMFTKEQNFANVCEIVKYQLPLYEETTADVFFRTYYGIMNEITRVTELENVKLGGGDAKAQALAEKLNFAELGRFPEIYNLYNDYEKGYNTPYSVGFAIQLLKKKQFDFEREYFKL